MFPTLARSERLCKRLIHGQQFGTHRHSHDQVPCCSTHSFHQRSTHMALDAIVKLRPTPPHLREAIIIFVAGLSPKFLTAFSRAGRLMLPLYYDIRYHMAKSEQGDPRCSNPIWYDHTSFLRRSS